MSSKNRTQPLTDEQLRELLDGHLESAAEDDWMPKFKGAVEKIQKGFFAEGVLDSKSDDELVGLAVDLYKSIVSPPMFVGSLKKNPTRLRQGIRFLLDNQGDMVACADAVLADDSPFAMRGVGKAFWSLFFMALDPAKNPYWNNKTEDALRKMGLADWRGSDSPGLIYGRRTPPGSSSPRWAE